MGDTTIKKNFLVVDDDNIANYLIERIVQSTGLAHTISKALNGQEALAYFTSPGTNGSRNLPDVVLLDLNMPIMNGFEFLQEFNNLNFDGKENILIMLVTSSSNPSDVDRAKSLGIRYYLTKPISTDTIKSIVEDEFSKPVNSRL